MIQNKRALYRFHQLPWSSELLLLRFLQFFNKRYVLRICNTALSLRGKSYRWKWFEIFFALIWNQMFMFLIKTETSRAQPTVTRASKTEIFQNMRVRAEISTTQFFYFSCAWRSKWILISWIWQFYLNMKCDLLKLDSFLLQDFSEARFFLVRLWMK